MCMCACVCVCVCVCSFDDRQTQQHHDACTKAWAELSLLFNFGKGVARYGDDW